MRNQQRPPHGNNIDMNDAAERNVNNNANIPRGAIRLQPRMNRGNAMPPYQRMDTSMRMPPNQYEQPNVSNNVNMNNVPRRLPRRTSAMSNSQNSRGAFLHHDINTVNENQDNVTLRRSTGRQELNRLEQNPRILKTDIPQVTPSHTKIQNTMIDDNLDFGSDDAIELGEMDLDSNQMLPPSNTPPPDYYDDPDDEDNANEDDDYIDDDINDEPVNSDENNKKARITDAPDELFNDSEPQSNINEPSHSNGNIPLKPSVNANVNMLPAPVPALPVPMMGTELPDADINANKDDGASDESSDNQEPEDDKDKKPNPLSSFMNVFKSKANDFISKAKNEIGDSQSDDENENEEDDEAKNDENGENDTENDEPVENNDKKDSGHGKDEQEDDGKKNADKPSVNKNNGIISMIISIITLPFRMLLFLFNTATQLIRIALSIMSALIVFIIIWLICNIPAAMSQSVPSFDTDEGTLTAKEVSYENNMITFKAENSSDMIAHAGITADVKAWKPFKKLPVSIFAPVQVQSCESTYVDINPGESKEITLKCTGENGLWMRPQVHLTGE